MAVCLAPTGLALTGMVGGGHDKKRQPHSAKGTARQQSKLGGKGND
jgi:hypothetical protein